MQDQLKIVIYKGLEIEAFPSLVFTWGLPELRVCKPLRSFLLLAALKRVSLAMMSSLAK